MGAGTSQRGRDSGAADENGRAEPGVAGPPTAHHSDHHLEHCLVELGRGDIRCFDHVYEAVAEHVLVLARMVLGDHAQAEEVTQEVLLELWRTASRYDPARASARGWITMITRRRAVDRLRSSVTVALTHQRATGPEVTYDHVLEQVEHNHDRQVVRDALDGLTVLQRESIVLAYYEGHTYADVATLLGVPAGTVKTRIRDGLTRLRISLADQVYPA